MTGPEIQDEVDFLREQRAALHRRTTADGKRDKFTDALLAPDIVLRAPVDADYVLPSHFAKTMSKARLKDLRALLGELREFCDGLTGMLDVAAIAQNNGDRDVLFLRDAFTDLMLAHMRDRLAKPSLKDNGNPLMTWCRLWGEFGVWYSDMCNYGPPGHHSVIGGTHLQLAWEMFQSTWAPHLEVDHVLNEMRLNDLDEGMADIAFGIVNEFTWDAPRFVERTMARLPDVAAGVTGDLDDLRAELAGIADDLREAKALLIRGYKPVEHLVTLPGGWVAAWSWDINQRAGTVEMGATPADLTQALGANSQTDAVMISLDGWASEALLPWLEPTPEAIRWSVGLLRPIRDRLLADWMAAPRPAPVVEGATTDAMAEGEAIAVACEALAELDEAEEEGSKGSRYKTRVPKVREHTLLLLMERHFACEVRNAKGSEVTVYRVGARIFTLPAKRRGQHMPAFEIERMLKRLGIPASEFAAVARKRG